MMESESDGDGDGDGEGDGDGDGDGDGGDDRAVDVTTATRSWPPSFPLLARCEKTSSPAASKPREL